MKSNLTLAARLPRPHEIIFTLLHFTRNLDEEPGTGNLVLIVLRSTLNIPNYCILTLLVRIFNNIIIQYH